MVLQWAVIVVLCVLVLSLMRQLAALTSPAIKERDPEEIFVPFTELPQHSVTLLSGREFRFGGRDSIPTLILFLAPNCGACEQLPDAIKALAQKLPAPDFLLLAVLKRSDAALAEEFVAKHALADLPVALDSVFPEQLNPGGAPFADAIAAGGADAARGKHKTLEHLLEMAQAARTMDTGVPSHSRRKHDWGESAPYWSPTQLRPQPLVSVSEPA